MLSDKSIVRYYDEYSPLYEAVWGNDYHFGLFESEHAVGLEKAQAVYTERVVDMGLSLLPVHRQDAENVILDLCCGKGPIYECLVKAGMRGLYLGVDLHDKFCQKTLERANKIGELETLKCRVHCGNVEECTRAWSGQVNLQQTVDLVFCQDSFYHMQDKAALIHHLSKIIKPGGVLVVSDFAVDREFSMKEEWKRNFISRQAGSMPATFERTGGGFWKSKLRFWQRVQKNNGLLAFEFEKMVSENNFFVVKKREKTSDLELTYSKALERFDANKDALTSIKKTAEQSKNAFEFMKTAAQHRNVKLMWWGCVTDIGMEETNQDSANRIASIRIGSEGYQYDTGATTAKVLRKMSLEVHDGDYIVIGGRTGSGKTTLLLLLGGLLAHTGETEIFFSQGIRTALVEQTPILLEELAVRQAICTTIRARAKNESRNYISERLFEILDSCSLLELAEKTIKKLSGGQRQRVALALALAAQPNLLLLDEPLSQQDAVSRRRLLGLLERFLADKNKKRAIIHVTHRFDEVGQTAEKRLFEIAGGQLLPKKATGSNPSAVWGNAEHLLY